MTTTIAIRVNPRDLFTNWEGDLNDIDLDASAEEYCGLVATELQRLVDARVSVMTTNGDDRIEITGTTGQDEYETLMRRATQAREQAWLDTDFAWVVETAAQ